MNSKDRLESPLEDKTLIRHKANRPIIDEVHGRWPRRRRTGLVSRRPPPRRSMEIVSREDVMLERNVTNYIRK